MKMASDYDNSTFNQLFVIYQQSRAKGEFACLSLETKGGRESIQFTLRTRCPAGNHAGQVQSGRMRRKKTPSQLRRDQRRKIEFISRKNAAKDAPDADTASSETTNRLIMELDKKETVPVDTGPPSPIIQLDGEVGEDVIKYFFESTYHEDDINELLSEIFIKSEINFDLESRVKVAPLSNREVFVIRLKPSDASKKNLTWPDMEKDQAEVFENVKRLK
jgi:hypothetical protein